MKRLIILLVVIPAFLRAAETIEDMQRTIKANQELASAAKELADAIERYKKLREEYKAVVLAKDVAVQLDAADKLAGLKEAAPTPTDAKSSILTAGKNALRPVFQSYCDACTKETERLKAQPRPLNMKEAKDAKEARDAAKANLDSLFKQVQEAREEFLSPYRAKALEKPKDEQIRQELVWALEAAIGYEKRH